MALGIIEIFLHAVPFILFLGGISTFYYAFQGVFTGRAKWWDDFGKRTEYDRNESPLKFWLMVIMVLRFGGRNSFPRVCIARV